MKCKLCQAISHVKCNDLNYVDGLYLKNSNISWYCQACCADMFQFTAGFDNYTTGYAITYIYQNVGIRDVHGKTSKSIYQASCLFYLVIF